MFSYRIDRRNSVLNALIECLRSDAEAQLETLLRLIEETVPVQRIWIDTADNQDGVAGPFEGEAQQKLRKHIQICHEVLCLHGLDPVKVWDQISAFPAFLGSDAQAIIGTLREGESC